MLVGGGVLGATAGYCTRPPSPKHPYLLAHAGDFVEVRKSLFRYAKTKAYYENLKRQAEQIIGAPPSFYRIPDPIKHRPHILWISRQVLERVYVLAMLYRLDGDQRYAERAWRELRAAADFPDWYPQHFLDTAEMSHAFAVGYDWLYDALVEEERTILRTAMMAKGLKPALERYRGQEPDAPWVKADTNWNLVCNSGIGLGALAVRDDAPNFAEEIEEVLANVLRSLNGAMSRFAPDGGWEEGTSYWNYGTRYVTLFLAALERARGTKSELLRSPGFSETGYFPLYLTGPTAQAFNFADSGASLPSSPHLFWHSRNFERPIYDWHEARIEPDRRSSQTLELLWYNAPSVKPQEEGLPLDKHFRGVDVVTFRSAWEDPDAVFVGFKAGDNRANHGHLDQGSFVLDALGARWALDLGAEDYGVPGYWDDDVDGQRWSYYRTRAEGHNTLVINPRDEPDQDPGAVSSILRFRSKPWQAFAVADLTAAYGQDVYEARRGIALLERQHVLIQDEVMTKYPTTVWWFMHTSADKLWLQDGGVTAILAQGDARLWARILSPEGMIFTIMGAQPLPGSPAPAERDYNEGVQKLGISLTNTTDLRLAVLLVPLREGEVPPVDLPSAQPLAEW